MGRSAVAVGGRRDVPEEKTRCSAEVLLTSKFVSVSATTPAGATALHHAAGCAAAAPLVRLLLASKARPDARDADGQVAAPALGHNCCLGNRRRHA